MRAMLSADARVPRDMPLASKMVVICFFLVFSIGVGLCMMLGGWGDGPSN